MASTFISLLVHLVFSSKERVPWLRPPVCQRLYPYLIATAQSEGVQTLAVAGTEDHVHSLLSLTATVATADLVRTMKANSSRWIHDTFPGMRGFGWQDGYAALSIGYRDTDAVVRYIRGQQAHHRRVPFREELVALLEENGIPFNEAYLL